MEGDFVEAGEHADLFFSLKPPLLPVAIPHRDVTDKEREVILDGMKSMYARFVGAVAKNRKMDPETVESLAQGRVWTGVEAKQNGLVDRIGGLQDAIMLARELAKIGPEPGCRGDGARAARPGQAAMCRYRAGASLAALPASALSVRWTGRCDRQRALGGSSRREVPRPTRGLQHDLSAHSIDSVQRASQCILSA